jgi:hypothetical protein
VHLPNQQQNKNNKIIIKDLPASPEKSDLSIIKIRSSPISTPRALTLPPALGRPCFWVSGMFFESHAKEVDE